MDDRGQRLNGSAERLETLSNRSIVRKLLYDNLWYAVRLGLGFREQLVDARSELTERAESAISGSMSVMTETPPKS